MNLSKRNMAHSSTKSIDVGGVFFMDLSVNDSDFNDDSAETAQMVDNNARGSFDTRRHLNHHQDKSIRLSPTYQSNDKPYSSMNRNQATSIVDQRSKATSMTTSKTTTQPPTSTDYLGSSLDRLASVINCDGQLDDMAPPINNDIERSLTIVRPQQQRYNFKELQSSCSLSDESYVPSGEPSLSASLAGSSDQEYEDKGSTTTREDSGVLDMKDLEGHLNNASYDDEHDHRLSTNSSKPLEQEKSISKNIMAANLINNSAIGKINFQYQQQENINYNINKNRSINKPTDGSSNTDHYHNNHRSNHSKRPVSASLPIQVPTRQMKKNLNRMKLNLMRDEEPAAIEPIAENNAVNSPVRKGDRNRPAIENIVAFDDDDAFLNQEFNANHHNHYPIDELDREHLTAGKDPMRFYESIQALAKSLHEDAELFGSLPPKRMLESPIRSITLV